MPDKSGTPDAFRTPAGTFDVLPPASRAYEELIATFAQHVERAGYGLILSPMFEDVGVFQRVGESTDVVRKEMYDFEDKGGRRIALRPEGTASVVRAFVQHRPPVPFKVWYAAPSFRYERPQAGRFRQHHQLGIEALGSEDPYLDVEVISLLVGFHRAAGIGATTLRLTSLGDDTCRPAYRAELGAYLEQHNAELCSEHRDRFAANPLRVLDCKRPECREATAGAPAQLDRLCEACQAHFAAVTRGLEALGIAPTIDRRLVRGLDYYTRTTFEVSADAIDAAQNGIGGGGRYDRLTAELGGPPTPGIGFGTGIERILLAAGRSQPEAAVQLDAFVVDTAGGTDGLVLAHALRAAGLSADRAESGRSMKAQMKAADRSGARLALIVGSAEVDRGVVTVRPLRGGGEQHEVARDNVVDHVRKFP